MKNSTNKIKGFTLMEVLIVVSILGIISAIAVPSYMEYVIKGKRADAKVELLRIAQLQESYFVQNLSYAKDLTVGAGSLGLGAMIVSEQGQYQITIDTDDSGGGDCTGLSADSCTAYTITARPLGSQLGDTKCGGLTLSNTGVKGLEVTDPPATGTVRDCW